jgi:hypothetical protein
VFANFFIQGYVLLVALSVLYKKSIGAANYIFKHFKHLFCMLLHPICKVHILEFIVA